ncbi:MAG: AAA family ATPase [Actinomycetota bacterium]|nr:AAA family ATPase [Actinomycetota bacterium]
METKKSEKEIILVVASDKDLANQISSLKLKSHNVVVLSNVNFIKHYLEEYMPEYVVLSAEFEKCSQIAEYIRGNTGSELLIIDDDEKENSVSEGIYLGGVRNIYDIKKILVTIDNLNSGSDLKIKDNYKILTQKVITFYSIQGGVGKTSILFNFAWFIKDIVEGRILIMDLNFCEGPSDLTINLNLELSPNLSVFMDNLECEVNRFGNSVVNLNEDNRIDILQPPLSIYQSDKFNIDMLNSIVYSARNKYDVIIADIPFRYDNISLEMLNLSTTSILVLSPDIKLFPRAVNFKKFLPKEQKKGIIFNKVGNYTKPYIDECRGIDGISVYNRISFISEKNRALIKNGRSFFNILDLQSEMGDIIKHIF